MSNGGTFNDPGMRSPMSWTGYPRTAGFTTGTPYHDVAINVASQNVAAEAGDPNSLLEYYRALYAVRRAHPVLGTGRMDLQSKAGDPVLVFRRYDQDDEVVVAINLSGMAQPLSIKTNSRRFIQALGGEKAAILPLTTGDDGVLKTILSSKAAIVLRVRHEK